MSILLDALRKSERRERLGGVPDIHSDVPEMETPRRRAWQLPAALVLTLTVLLAAGYGTWRWLSQPEAPTVATAPAERESAAQARGFLEMLETVDAVPLSDEAADPQLGSGPAATPASGANDPAPPRLTQQPRSPVESLSGDRPYRPAAANAAPPPDPVPASSSDASSAADAPARVVEQAPPPPRSVEIEPTEAALVRAEQEAAEEALARRLAADEPADQRVPPRTEERRTARASEPDDDSISYWQLPENVRKNLPELRINVMVYNEEPAQRFIIMGGKRYGEGALVARNLALEEVRRDRALFRHGAYLFFVRQ